MEEHFSEHQLKTAWYKISCCHKVIVTWCSHGQRRWILDERFSQSKQFIVSTSGLFWNRKVSKLISLWQYSNLVAHVDYPSTMLPKWQKHLPHKLHSQPHLPMETTCYGEAWRAFRKQNFGLCSTTYYSTVPITCTQTWIHGTQSLHYDKLLKRSSLRHIVTTNFAASFKMLANVFKPQLFSLIKLETKHGVFRCPCCIHILILTPSTVYSVHSSVF